jgi:lysylphosphatidylglycerol synthetase-like protein (DUF2156 family)
VESGCRVETRRGHEGLWTLLSSGYGTRVNGHVPLPRVAISWPRCTRPDVGASGGGGLAKGATMAATVVAVLAVVAAAIAAVAVSVVVLVPVSAVTVVAATGRARRRGGRRLGHRGCSVGFERHRSSRRTRTIHVDLLH